MTIDLSILDEGALQDWIVQQRWFGSKAREVASIEIVECIPLREETPQLALALVEARFGEGTHETYQVPLGLRPVDEGWNERVIGNAGDWTVYDALADPAAGRELLHRMRRSSEETVEEGTLRFSLGRVGGRRARRDGRRAAGRRRAVELVGGVRRGADPEGVPARRAGREPGARAAALPVRARVPQHRAARRLVRVRGPLHRRHAGDPAGVPGGRPRRLGARAGGDRVRPRRLPRPPARARRGDRRAAHGARLGQQQAGLRARPAEPGGAVAADRRRRRADRADLPRPAGERGGRADRRPRPGRARAAAGAVAHRRRRPRDPHARRLPPRPDHAHRPRLGDPRLRGRAGAAAARAPAEALAAARRGGDAALVLLRDRRRAAAARRRGARGLGGARANGLPRGLLRPRRLGACSRRARRRPRSCWPCSSSRRRSTSCATSSTTAPTGSASRSPGSCGCSRATDQSPGCSGRACDHSSGFDHDFGRGCTRYLPCWTASTASRAGSYERARPLQISVSAQ